MENNKIKVSVIIPVYNTEKYVREAILSITQQSLKELEIIIINDGSTDGSLDIVEKISNKESVSIPIQILTIVQILDECRKNSFELLLGCIFTFVLSR